jgi:hypothetical protein
MYLRLTRGRFDPANYDSMMQVVPEVAAAIRGLPGVQQVQIGIDRENGRTLSLITLDSLEHARFSRDSLGPSLERLRALGWIADDPEIYDVPM